MMLLVTVLILAIATLRFLYELFVHIGPLCIGLYFGYNEEYSKMFILIGIQVLLWVLHNMKGDHHEKP